MYGTKQYHWKMQTLLELQNIEKKIKLLKRSQPNSYPKYFISLEIYKYDTQKYSIISFSINLVLQIITLYYDFAES